MEDLQGLKFRILNKDELVVENNNYTEPKNSEELILYNFEQMERFCHRLGKSKCSEEFEKFAYRYYIVVKNFKDEKMHIPGKEAEIYSISRDINYNLSFLFTIYTNGKSDLDKGFISIDIVNPFFSAPKSYEKVICFISVIDTEGKEKYTQTAEFKLNFDKDDIKSFHKFINRKIVLVNQLELLHCNDLILCVNLEFPKVSDEEEICLFEKYPDKINSQAFLLDSDIGNKLCEHSPLLQEMFRNIESKDESFIKKDIKNICRLLILTDFITVIKCEDISGLYKVAFGNKNYHLMQFCRRHFERCLSFDNILCIDKLATMYGDDDLQMAVERFKMFNIKYGKFVCNKIDVYSTRTLENNKTDDLTSEHIHYALDEYPEYRRGMNFTANLSRRIYIETKIEKYFSSYLKFDEYGEVELLINSDFGKLLCQKSEFFKRMMEHSWVETQRETMRIQAEDIEVLKNIYRILMGAIYVKASNISDIISLYEKSDYYLIPDVMNACICLIKEDICIRNVEPIRKLTEKSGDVTLKEIVKKFEEQYNRGMEKTLHYKIPFQSIPPDDPYDFYQ